MTRRDGTPIAVSTVESSLMRIAPQGIHVAARWISSDDLTSLHPVELTAVATATVARQREFASGRALLRQLIGRDMPIPSRPDRRPHLPDDFAASLAHDSDVVVAALAPMSEVRGVGIDVEPMTTLEREVAETIVRPDEADVDPLLAFVIKEATYKAWSNAGGGMLSHHDVRLSIHGQRFLATVLANGLEISGAFHAAAGRAYALAVLPRGQASDPWSGARRDARAGVGDG